MLTPEQLADYKRVTLAAIVGPTKQAESKFENMAYAMVPALIEEVERLQTALTAKDKLLDQIDESTKRIESKVNSLETNINSLVDAIKVKDHVLSQFADSENWTCAPSIQFVLEDDLDKPVEPVYIWHGDSPITLANQALGEGKE